MNKIPTFVRIVYILEVFRNTNPPMRMVFLSLANLGKYLVEVSTYYTAVEVETAELHDAYATDSNHGVYEIAVWSKLTGRYDYVYTSTMESAVNYCRDLFDTNGERSPNGITEIQIGDGAVE